MSMFHDLAVGIESRRADFDVCGFISRAGVVYPLGTDTKVLSTVFELVVRPTVVSIAERYGYEVKEPTAQNHYPDFTLVPIHNESGYIAIDVKTTYRRSRKSRFSFTLGGYTSFLRESTPSKNIMYPYERYQGHWVIGFVYTRVAEKKAAEARTFSPEDIGEITLPYKEVEFFVQEKWRVAGTSAGSGNTTNIGSIRGTIDEFREGAGVFRDEAEYLMYWRSYGTKSAARTYSNIEEFRASKRN